MKRTEKLRLKLDRARAGRAALIAAGKLVEAGRANARVAAIERELADAERYEPRLLGEILDRKTLAESGLSRKLIETHLAADFLADCAFDLRETLGKLGLADCSVFPMLRSIQKQAQAYAGIVCHPEFAGLSDFMCNNERLIDDLHLLCRRYIAERINLTDDPAGD